MTTTSDLRFQKRDAYQNLVFSSSVKVDEKTYDDLSNKADKMNIDFSGQFNALYKSPSYDTVSVRFDRFDYKFKPNAIYRITWLAEVRYKKTNNERYLLLKIHSVKFLRAEIVEDIEKYVF